MRRCRSAREALHSLDSFVASDSIHELTDGSWYLVEKDSASRRQYNKKGKRRARQCQGMNRRTAAAPSYDC